MSRHITPEASSLKDVITQINEKSVGIEALDREIEKTAANITDK